MTAPRQLTRQDLEHMTPEAVAHATLQGRCNALLGAPVPFDPDADRPPEPPQLPDPGTGTATEWREALAPLTEAQFNAAKEAGLFPPWLLGEGDPPAPDAPSVDQGARGADRSSKTPLQQLLAGKSPEEIKRMTDKGMFQSYLDGTGPHS